MLNTFQQAALFVIQVSFEFYIMVLVLRLVLHLIRAEIHHPISQFVVKLTRPTVQPLQRYLPVIRGIDSAVVTLIIALEIIKVSLLFYIEHRTIHNFAGLVIYGFGDFFDQIITLYFYAILFQIIISWIRPNQYNPIIDLLFRITAPIMGPAQRLIPTIGGIDISPIPVMMGLKLLEIIVAYPMMNLGQGMALLP